MGLGALGELQLRSRGANGRSRSELPVPYTTLQKGRHIIGLTALDDDTVDWLQKQHSISDGIKSAQTKKNQIVYSTVG